MRTRAVRLTALLAHAAHAPLSLRDPPCKTAPRNLRKRASIPWAFQTALAVPPQSLPRRHQTQHLQIGRHSPCAARGCPVGAPLKGLRNASHGSCARFCRSTALPSGLKCLADSSVQPRLRGRELDKYGFMKYNVRYPHERHAFNGELQKMPSNACFLGISRST